MTAMRSAILRSAARAVRPPPRRHVPRRKIAAGTAGRRGLVTCSAVESAASSSSRGFAPDDGLRLPPRLSKVLVANRGEIAVRIIETARRLGVRTVAVYSTADARSPHVSAADEAVCVGPPASGSSYLDVGRICRAAELTGADGVHPGYGFLSENADFARAVEGLRVMDTAAADGDGGSQAAAQGRRKVRFVGPSSSAIAAMGDKIQSKLIAEAAGVTTIPGHDGAVDSAGHAVEIARGIGYPVMIKASSGGGGKGMRICRTDEQVVEGYRLGRAEARSFFGDDRLLVEKYVEDPRHIEIQVLSGRNPATGVLDVLCFAERECSIQRRNQKVVEESPSPMLARETRREMIRQVKSLVREVEYESAGTVEFLVDAEQNFYFLEMNTRLQVEHPVTEMISGDGYASGNYVDLVHGMLEVASGRGVPREYLDMVQSDPVLDARDGGEGANVRYTGHAIEARVYAEDPFRGFLPSTGPLVKYVEPPDALEIGGGEGSGTFGDEQGRSEERRDGGGELCDGDYGVDDPRDEGPKKSACHIRVDTGVAPGYVVSPHYDPILSKIISYSETSRAESIEGLGRAIDRYKLRGVMHNVPFIRDVLRNADFVRGETPTGFIDAHYPDGFSGGRLTDTEMKEYAAIAALVHERRRAETGGPPLPLDAGGAAGGGPRSTERIVCVNGMFGDAYRVRTEVGPGGFTTCSVAMLGDEEDAETVVKRDRGDVNYHPRDDFACVPVSSDDSRVVQVHGEDEMGQLKLTMFGLDADFLVTTPGEYELTRHMKEPVPVDLGDYVMSPMPGTLVSFAVKEGDMVEMGQELCVVEAMKMQNIIRSHKAGARVSKLHGEVGASLRADEILLEFEKEITEEDEEEVA